MNKVQLKGRITKEIVIRKSSNDNDYTFFTIAISAAKDKTDYVDCVAWGETAIKISQEAPKGSLIEVEGKVSPGTLKDKNSESYEKWPTNINIFKIGEITLPRYKEEVESTETPASENKANVKDFFET